MAKMTNRLIMTWFVTMNSSFRNHQTKSKIFQPVVLEVREDIVKDVRQQWNDTFFLFTAVDNIKQCYRHLSK